jgi:hypothetical protein
MSKLTSAVLAAAFAVATVSPVAFAQEKPASTAAIQAACKDKQPGDTVQVDGKDVKCPAAGAGATKPEAPKKQ